MARYSVETNLSPEAAIEKVVAYFGSGGQGLDLVEDGACCARLEGGGGYVYATAGPGDKKTVLELETREWDYDVRRFLKKGV